MAAQTTNLQVVYINPNPLYNHNKGVIVDGKHTAVSSVNWGAGSTLHNREAGVVIYNNTQVADYFTAVFNYDFTHGCAQRKKK